LSPCYNQIYCIDVRYSIIGWLILLNNICSDQLLSSEVALDYQNHKYTQEYEHQNRNETKKLYVFAKVTFVFELG